MTTKVSMRHYLAGTVLVVLLAAGLRFHLLENQSFWNDEGNTARLSERSAAKIIEGTASDIHPPLYYLLLRLWREGAGAGEFGLRSFSVYAGILTCAGTITLARRIARRRARLLALVAGLLTAMHPGLVYYSQEARMYSLLALCSVLSTLFFWRWFECRLPMRSPTKRRKPAALYWGAAYVLAAAAGLYTHYFFPVVIAVQQFVFISLFLKWQRQRVQPLVPLIRDWLLMSIAAGALYLPWIPIFLAQFGGDAVQRGAPGPFLVAALRWLAAGRTLPAETFPWLPWTMLLLMVIGAVAAGERGLLPLAAVVAPAGFIFLAGATGAEFLKFLVMGAPFVAILAGLAITEFLDSRLSLIGLVLALLLPLVAYQALGHMYRDPTFFRADYRGMAARIQEAGYPHAGIILNAPNQWEVFTYYYPDAARVYPLPRGRSRPEPAEVAAVLAEISNRHERIYAIFWGEEQRDPERLVERWLDAHAFKAVDEWVGDVRFVMYASPPAFSAEMTNELDYHFGEAITLEGFSLHEVRLQPGDVVQVALFWRTAVPITERYKVFLHLLNADGVLVAQRDSEPGGGLALTNSWPVQQTIPDNHGILLPLNLPPGRYTLQLGLYDLLDPVDRLWINEAASNALQLAEIEVFSNSD